MLIDDYLPEFDAVERHALVIRAAPAQVWAALRAADFGRSPLIATLLGLRALPSLLIAPRRTLRRLRERHAGPVTLDTFFSRGFVVLDERPDREMVIGLEGRFWTRPAISDPPTRGGSGRRWPRAWRERRGTSAPSPCRTAACGSPPRRGCAARTRPRAGASAPTG